MRLRNRQLNIRLSAAEMMLLQRQAEKAKYSVSNYVRALINGNSPKECPPLDFSDLIGDVRDSIAMMGDIQEAIRTVDYRDRNSFMELDSWISDELIFQRDMLLKIQAAVQLPDKAKV